MAILQNQRPGVRLTSTRSDATATAPATTPRLTTTRPGVRLQLDVEPAGPPVSGAYGVGIYGAGDYAG